jgi:hypothetical protein
MKKETAREEKIDYRITKKKSFIVQKKEVVAATKIRINTWF